MSASWPESLVIRFTHNGHAVANLVVHLLILSSRKNNFPMGPFVTNVCGEVVATRGALESAIAVSMTDFPMDYDGTLADCTDVEVIIDDGLGLEKRLERLREFYPVEAEKLRALVQGCANGRFAALRTRIKVDLKGVAEVVLHGAVVKRH